MVLQGLPNSKDMPMNDVEDAEEFGYANDENVIKVLRLNNFMKSPSKLAVDAAIATFIDQTGNSALAMATCAVCARETRVDDLTSLSTDSFPNHHRLVPAVSHPQHDIYNGMLLHPSGLSKNTTGEVCAECLGALKSDRVPRFALANGMWIGRIPHELAYLTLPERLLIAKYFPASYIIKLFPKKKGARFWDKRQMYSGLKGNVCTYQLDQALIASMIDGTIMPQPPEILAATTGITFVGPKNLPERCLPDMFRVRRARVKEALEWLKQYNPLFANIVISSSRLDQLPENDVPLELMLTAKHSTDVGMLATEHDGYVPTQEKSDSEGDGDSEPKMSDGEDIQDPGPPIVPTVMPLSHLGVVDVDGVDLSETELMV